MNVGKDERIVDADRQADVPGLLDCDTGSLHARLDPLPTPRHTAAIDELCHALNDTNTV
jgi:hypothetical protein